MPVEFSDESLSAAQAGAKRLQNAVNNVLPYVGSVDEKLNENAIEEFKSAMNEDLNTSKALAVLFELANNANKSKDENNKEMAQIAVSTLLKLSEVLGFDFSNIESITYGRRTLYSKEEININKKKIHDREER